MNALELKNVCKNYKDFTLDHLSLTLPQGCIMGLIGENGAGKSTTIKLILDMISMDSGSISILGRDSRVESRSLKEEIGVVLDETGFSECLTALQVGKVMAGIFQSWDNALFAGYLKRFSLPEKKPFKAYSRGMKMKLAIAAALSHHPRLLVLDEATSGLDPVVRDEVTDIFSEFTREEDHAVLISSHIISDLEKICDYIAFLHKGKLLLCEEKDRLKEEYGVIRCPAEEFRRLSVPIIGKKESPYGVEAIAARKDIPRGMAVGPIDLEQLFIFMVKEEQ